MNLPPLIIVDSVNHLISISKSGVNREYALLQIHPPRNLLIATVGIDPQHIPEATLLAGPIMPKLPGPHTVPIGTFLVERSDEVRISKNSDQFLVGYIVLQPPQTLHAVGNARVGIFELGLPQVGIGAVDGTVAGQAASAGKEAAEEGGAGVPPIEESGWWGEVFKLDRVEYGGYGAGIPGEVFPILGSFDLFFGVASSVHLLASWVHHFKYMVCFGT